MRSSSIPNKTGSFTVIFVPASNMDLITIGPLVDVWFVDRIILHARDAFLDLLNQKLPQADGTGGPEAFGGISMHTIVAGLLASCPAVWLTTFLILELACAPSIGILTNPMTSMWIFLSATATDWWAAQPNVCCRPAPFLPPKRVPQVNLIPGSNFTNLFFLTLLAQNRWRSVGVSAND